MSTKYKYITGIVLALAFLVTPLLSTSAPATVHADPVPSCNADSGAVLVPEQGDNPAYCKCPAGQYLITGNDNKCSGQCPDGNTSGRDANGNAYCNAPLPADSSSDSSTDKATQSGNCSDISKCDLITNYVQPFINFLAAFVGLAVVITIIIAGIQYGGSAGDAQKVTAAKNRIRNAVVALLMFLFLYALLNFLIPGGLV